MLFGHGHQRIHSALDGFVVGEHRFPFALDTGCSRLGVGCKAEEPLEFSEIGRRKVEFRFLGVFVALIQPR